MTRRSRRLLAAAAMVAAAAPLAALGLPEPAAAGSLDVVALHGSGAGLRVTVQTGYSFVVEPDAMLPRAEAAIEADQVRALASPLDPGDSVDALPGLGVPTAEQDIKNGAAGGCPCPSPLPTSSPPPQFAQAVGTAVDTFASVFNPALTTQYEHAQAVYPYGQSTAAQQAAFPPGSGGPVPPDYEDVNGLLSAHSSTGTVLAAQGHGNARAGVGAAVSLPALGLRVGRIDSQVDVRGDGSGSVSQVTTTLHDVDLGAPSLPGVPLPALPTGTSVLHIGTLVLSATTQRLAGAAKATSHTDLEASGVTVAGVGARFDQNGLSLQAPAPLNGLASPLNAVAQTLVNALNSPQGCTPAAPVGIPNVGSITSVPSLRIGPPTLQDQVTHNGNEDSVAMTGPTLCIATSAPIPGTNGQVAATPTIYTVTLGDVSSSAYGVALPADSGTTDFSPVMPDTGTTAALTSGGTVDTTTSDTAAPPGAASTPAPAPPHAATRGLYATLTGGILSRRVVVTVALLAEMALLGTLWASWLLARRAGRRGGDDDSPTTRMDLV